jgi:peptide/nickel transport system permease protein
MTTLRTDRIALVALAVLATIAALAMLAPLIAPYDPAHPIGDYSTAKWLAPSLAHPFGTDGLSRDVLARVLYGARISLTVASLAMLLAVTVGVAYGAIAGFRGGATDAVMMRALDAAIGTPRVLVLIAALAFWRPISVVALVIVLGLTGWFEVSRLVRAEVAALRDDESTLAARALGADDRRILARHILPRVMAPVLAAAAVNVASLVALEAGLSFLGIGVAEPTPSWGNIIYDGIDTVREHWWLSVFPGIAIVITVAAFNVLGDRLREALDPRQVVGR